ncbi:MFS family permease [Actinoplanes lutulentus]|uniref:MFS transporter n=1 Tax=Actinoplanes lutulentus TaxID=1287878 RepID=A0A327ZIN2_9ACTN|nr:MFS transporter [Actinoplanes lutulentus]MBB2943960.1 MFS family permease [Actinoplanes lutulentus]RAK42807.1 MFS transporter [Actinoplanes lutulentus]
MSEVAVAAPAEAAGKRGWSSRQVLVLLVIGTAALMVSLTQSLLVPVLNELGTDLNAGSDGVAWLLTSTLLVGAVAVPAFGRLGDLYGTKKMVLISLSMLVLGSLVCAFSDSLAPMIAGRAIVGLSVATVPLSISLVGVVLPREHSAAGIALISAMLGVGGALGLPLSGLVAEYADYHVLFWICVAGGLLVIPLIARMVPAPQRAGQGRMDIPGTILLGGAMLALLLPLAQGDSWGWTDPLTIGLLITSAVLLAVFIIVELRISSPLVDVRTTARPALLLTNVASLFVGFALFATLIGTATYVQMPEVTGYGFGKSILVGGLCMLPGGIIMLVLSPLSAKLAPRTALIIGSLIIAVGFASRIFLTDSLWQVILGATVAGAGTGIAYAAMPGLISHATPLSELAAANGLNSLFRSVGSSLASAIGGALLAAKTVSLGGHELPSLGAYQWLFALCAGAAVLAAALALLIPKHSATADAAIPE